MKRFLLFMMAISLAYAGAIAKPAENVAVREYRASMKQMMNEMHIAYSGEVDTDFARGMIPHHQAAIRMANTVLRHGGADKNIRSLAKWIIMSQEAEIGQMQRWLDRRGEPEPSKTADAIASMPYVAQSEADMQVMHRDMDIVYSGDTLEDFVCGMIPHHQGAIDMAEVELTYGRKPEMQALARNIIRSQKADIGRMQRWLEDNSRQCKTVSSANHAHAHHH